MIRLEQAMFRLDTPADIHDSVQTAIELEHATIPPYLYAVFSLMPIPDPVDPAPDPNSDIRNLISSVVAEEMAHMALACNLLNAIGGSPVINKPGFLPAYPGPLPGGVEDDLTVHIAPFSIDVVRNTFMVIEEPEQQDGGQPDDDTIGAFYRKLLEGLEAAGDSIFTGDPALQVSGLPSVAEVVPIHSLDDARKAIEVIVEQGEGTGPSPLDGQGQYAHFWRFKEIAEGNMLVPDPGADPPFAFTGPPIDFDAASVLKLKANPKRGDYASTPGAQQACDNFNYTYTTLLNALHDTFNGSPGRMVSAVGLMEALWEQAMILVQFVIDEATGTRAGPSFEYQPTNPGAGA